MRRPRFVIVLAFILVGGVSFFRTTVGQGAGFQEKILNGWEKYLNAIACRKAGYRRIIRSYDHNGDMQFEFDYKKSNAKGGVSFFGGKNVIVEVESFGGNSQFEIRGRNEDYEFIIQRKKGSERWRLVEVAPIDAKFDNDPKSLSYFNSKNRILGVIDSTSIHTVPSIGVYQLRTLLGNRERLKIEPVGGASATSPISCEFGFVDELLSPNLFFPVGATDPVKVSKVRLKGEVELGDAPYYLPKTYDIFVTYFDEQGAELAWFRRTGELEYDDSSIPLLRQLKNTTLFFDDPDSNSVVRRDFWDFGNDQYELKPSLTEADFRLPAFGLPEPPFVKPKRAWWFWPAIGVGAGGVLFLIGTFIKRRRREAG